jgi:hypothetical protein
MSVSKIDIKLQNSFVKFHEQKKAIDANHIFNMFFIMERFMLELLFRQVFKGFNMPDFHDVIY